MRRMMPRPRRYRDVGVTVSRRDRDAQKTPRDRGELTKGRNAHNF